MRLASCLIFFLFFYNHSEAQDQPAGKGRIMNARPATGRLYGKVIEAKTGKAIEFAAVQVMQNIKDSISGLEKETLTGGQLSRANGDFSLENIPLRNEYILKISALGYTPSQTKFVFDGSSTSAEQDMGNITLTPLPVQLSEVSVEGSTPAYEMKIDKKVYDVEKNPVSAGGTAEDVLRNVPSVNIDIDGSVTMRNGAPQIFIDGRPATLTIDQIPADAIQSIEVISNPSAKYDASGGMAGILNIVLKKSRRIGYSGSVRAGGDSRGRLNGGTDLNVREGKINVFLNASANQRKSQSNTQLQRLNLADMPLTSFQQENNSVTNGIFGMGKAGFDLFIDNRNTLTLSGYYHQGQFEPSDNIYTLTDTLYENATQRSITSRISESERVFKSRGSTILFKHLFPKEGSEWTADLNYNSSNNNNEGIFTTRYYDNNGAPFGTIATQKQESTGKNSLLTAQTDVVHVLSGNKKAEGGLRAAFRKFESVNDNFIFDPAESSYVIIPSQSNDYAFTDRVFAGYLIFSDQISQFSYQAGFRMESSFYDGSLFSSSQEFANDYPLSLFPSLAAAYKINDKNDLQAGYARRINRPNFFQLLPYTDYSDSLNLSRGNPSLRPEFTNSVEFSWLRNFSRKNSILTTLYFKNSTDLITRYLITEHDASLNKSLIISTYENANSGNAYGIELTSQNNFNEKTDVVLNINAYNSVINGKNIEQNLTNEQLTWFAKINVNRKLRTNFSVQFSGDYQSKASLQLSTGGGGRGGSGNNYGSGPASTAQGFIRENYGADIALKYEFLKNNSASLTLGISDVFKTRKQDVHSESAFFIQDSLRKRDQQVIRLNFSYRFGKFDTSILRRKNDRNSQENIQEMPGM